MKKILFCSYLGILLSLFLMPVSAEEVCSNADKIRLGKIAGNVNIDYEPVLYQYSEDDFLWNDPNTGEPAKPDTYYRIQVNIYNLTEELRVEVKNKTANENYSFDYNDTQDGELALDGGMALNVKDIDFEIYGSGSCYNEKFKTVNLKLPMYNERSNYDICNEIPEYDLCKTFVTSEIDMSETEFSKKVQTYKLEKEEKQKEEDQNIPIVDFVKKHWKVILISGGVLIVVGAGVAVVVIRKRRRRLV